MGQNKVYNSNTYGHPEASNKASYKATVKSATAQQAATSRPNTSGRNGENKGKPDVWGPIYRNRQHFVDMHICWGPLSLGLTWNQFVNCQTA